MSVVPVRRLRVEEPKPSGEAAAVPVTSGHSEPGTAAPTQDAAYWRRMAVDSGQRLSHMENQAKDLRQAADEARARFGKYKQRLDAANARVNELQAELIAVSAERDALREQLAKQEVLARRVHEFRESILHGPIWDLFVELAVGPPVAGEKKRDDDA